MAFLPLLQGRSEIDDKQKHCVPSLDWLESSFKIPQEIRNIYWLKKIKLKRLFNFANAILDLHVTFLKGLWVVIFVTWKTYIENLSYLFQLGSILRLINQNDYFVDVDGDVLWM